MATFDPSQPYALVYYDELGRAFEQHGNYFTGGGQLWVDPAVTAAAPPDPKVSPKSPQKRAATVATPAAPEDEQLNAQMAGA